MPDDETRAARERLVREHMAAENALDFARALGTFGHRKTGCSRSRRQALGLGRK